MGAWLPGSRAAAFDGAGIVAAIQAVRRPLAIVRDPSSGRLGVSDGGEMLASSQVNGKPSLPLVGTLPPIYPEWLGDRAFNEAHGLRFPYVAGAMANGIATTRLVVAMARAGMLGFFGAAGLALPRVEEAIEELATTLGADFPWGVNLIHSPQEPAIESGCVDLLLRHGVQRVSASAYMSLTPHIVRYACSGLREAADGHVLRRHHVFAKISRPEVAGLFMSPAPASILKELVAGGQLTADEAALAGRVPVAEDIIVESDSGGHTDNRPLGSLFPVIAALAADLSRQHGYALPVRVGAAGGIGTPAAAASAFAHGAAFILTGSVNQGAVESGLSEEGREMLATAGLADVIMAAAADMFELGVKLQVLKRGTLFGPRANKLYEAFKTWASIDAIPPKERQRLEQQVLGATFDEVWAETRSFWASRDPGELERAERDPRHRLALCCRWYLGRSSRWAIAGDSERRMDYQIWCGPAMGAFNAWVAGSFLEPVAARSAVQIALNLLEGAAVATRAQQLRSYGVAVPPAGFQFRPRPLS